MGCSGGVSKLNGVSNFRLFVVLLRYVLYPVTFDSCLSVFSPGLRACHGFPRMIFTEDSPSWSSSPLLLDPFYHIRWITDFSYCEDTTLDLWFQKVPTVCIERPSQLIYARVPPTRVSRNLTVGSLIKLLTSFTQPTRLKLNRCVGDGVIDVGTLIWLSTSRM